MLFRSVLSLPLRHTLLSLSHPSPSLAPPKPTAPPTPIAGHPWPPPSPHPLPPLNPIHSPSPLLSLPALTPSPCCHHRRPPPPPQLGRPTPRASHHHHRRDPLSLLPFSLLPLGLSLPFPASPPLLQPGTTTTLRLHHHLLSVPEAARKLLVRRDVACTALSTFDFEFSTNLGKLSLNSIKN